MFNITYNNKQVFPEKMYTETIFKNQNNSFDISSSIATC